MNVRVKPVKSTAACIPKASGTPVRDGFLLVSVSLLMGIILAVGTTLFSYVFNSRKAAQGYQQSISALNLADAGISKALYCLNATNGDSCGGTYGANYAGESQVPMGIGKYTVLIAGNGNSRTISAIGQSETGMTEIAKVEMSRSTLTRSLNLDSALIVGGGGLSLGNNSQVIGGPVHSASSVSCGNNVLLDGPAYVSQGGGLIDNCILNGDAHADQVTNSQLNGHDVYYGPTNTGNSAVAHAYGGQPPPSPEATPAIDLDLWHAQAAAGGVFSGDKTFPDNAIADLGPIKITGNLTVSNNAVITVRGPIWVQGNLNLMNNAQLALDPGFGANSTIIAADGAVKISNNGVVLGSGDSRSFILMYAGSAASPAISVSNNAAGAIFVAPNGLISVSNNAAVTAAAGDSVSLSNNCVIDYVTADHDASDVVISSGEASIGPWIQTPRTWREAH